MPIQISIQGENAKQALDELHALSAGLTPKTTEVSYGQDEEQSEKPAPAKRTRKAAPKKEPEPKPETPDAAADDSGDDEGDGPTEDDVKRTVRRYLTTFDNNTEGQKAAQALLLDNFEVKKVGDLSEDQYPTAIRVFESAIDERGE